MDGNGGRPLVTVVIPTYNRAALLPRAIRSVIAQTHRPLELIVVDDGSSDNTREVVAGFAEPWIRFIAHDRNQGQCAAINTGVANARGEFVAFLDSDDEWQAEMIAKQLAVFASGGESMGAVYVHAGSLRADGTLAPSHPSGLAGDIYAAALTQGFVAHSIALLVRKSSFDRVGGFDPRFSTFQDDDLCFRLAREYRFGLVPEMLAIIHPGAGDQLTGDPGRYAQGWQALLEKHGDAMRAACGDAALARHYFRAGLLFLDARRRRAAFSSFWRSCRLAPSLRACGGVAVSVLPFSALWIALFRARPLVRRQTVTTHP
jgi:glycosyltransferase involved in cell wall biosynthesis